MKKMLPRIILGILGAIVGSMIACFCGMLISILTGNGLSIWNQPRTTESQIIGISQIIGAVIGARIVVGQGWKTAWTKQMSIELATVIAIISCYVAINLSMESKSQAKAEAGKILSSINLMQQVYHDSNNQFAISVDRLDFKVGSDFYRYDIVEADTLKTVAKAFPKRDELKSGVAAISKMNSQFFKIVCESRNNSENIQTPTLSGTIWNCANDSNKVF